MLLKILLLIYPLIAEISLFAEQKCGTVIISFGKNQTLPSAPHSSFSNLFIALSNKIKNSYDR
jgi:hypothetical protein